MAPERGTYKAYLLRLWWVNDGAARVYRASVEDSQTRERIGFAGIEELIAFLRAQTENTVTSGETDEQNA